MKVRLFDVKTLLVSLKGLGASITAYLLSIPLWFLSFWILGKGLIALGMFSTIFSMIVSFLFFGYFGRKWFNWK